MVTLILIFRNIKNPEDVLNFYVDHISPIMHQYPGVIGTDLHSVSELSPKYPQEFESIQLITQTYFESYEMLAELLSSKEGMQMMKSMENQELGEYYLYWTRVKRFENDGQLSKALDQHSKLDIEDIVPKKRGSLNE